MNKNNELEVCIQLIGSGEFRWISLNGRTSIETKLLIESYVQNKSYMVVDYSGFYPFSISEYEPIEQIALLVEGYKKYGSAFFCYLDLWRPDNYESEKFEDYYRGFYQSEEEFASDWYEEGEVSSQTISTLIKKGMGSNVKAIVEAYINLHSLYFDWEQYTKDLFLNSFKSVEMDGGVHVFSY